VASRLVNLRRTLTWQDFGTPRPGSAPGPGQTATAAQTRARPRRSVFAEPVPGLRPPQFRLRDDVNITIELDPNQTFVMAWVFQQPVSFQNSLLHHEQGHYDLVALFCRDMFIDAMALKTQTFPNAQAVLQAVQNIFNQYDRLIAAVHAPYDNDTLRGGNSAQQSRWDGFIQTAFTQPRSPAVQAPDGTPYKTPLLDVLRQGGVQI
jgi:hypothetical protein